MLQSGASARSRTRRCSCGRLAPAPGADERGRRAARGAGGRLVPAGAERRPRRPHVRRVGRAARATSSSSARASRGRTRARWRSASAPACRSWTSIPAKLRYVHDMLGGHVTTVMSNRANIEEEALDADLVIGTVLIPGALAPKLLPRTLVRAMRRGRRARRHLHRPGRLCRDVPTDDARRSDVRRGGRGALLRDEHARGRPAHLDLRAHERDALVRARDRRSRFRRSAPRLGNRSARRERVDGKITHPGVAAAVSETAVDVATLI